MDSILSEIRDATKILTKDAASAEADRRKALTLLDNSIMPKFQQIYNSETTNLQEMKSMLDTTNNGGILRVILSILSSDLEAEIMREKSIHVLRKLFQPIFDTTTSSASIPNSSATCYTINEEEFQIVLKFFVVYSSIILNRFHNVPSILLSKQQQQPSDLTTTTTTPGIHHRPEPVEEIRLLMMTLLSDILSYFKVFKNKSNCIVFNNHDVIDAFSRICQILPFQYALLDPYPELKRECCLVLQKLCHVAPSSVILGHLDSLVQPLTFPSSSMNESISSSGGGLVAKLCVLQHRHTKTRVRAIETANAVVMSLLLERQPAAVMDVILPNTTNVGMDDNNRDMIKRQQLQLRQSNAIHGILESKVFPSWKQCVLDRSALVRKVIIESVGNISLALIQIKYQENSTKKVRDRSIFSPKLLQLLFGSLGDDAEENRFISKKLLENVSLGSSFLWLDNGTGGQLNAFAYKFVPYFLPLELEDASNWSAPRRFQAIRSIDAAFNAMLTFDADDDDDGLLNEKSILEISDEWMKLVPLNELVSTLCLLIEDEEPTIRNAAASCAMTLGKHPQIGSSITLNLLSRIQGETHVIKGSADSTSSDFNTKPNNVLFAATTPALLSVLSNVARSSDYHGARRWMEAMLRDICVVLSGRRILHHFMDRQVMWQLTAACETIADVTNPTFFVSPSSNVHTCASSGCPLIAFMRCCIQILGCPDSFGLTTRGSDMIDKLSNEYGSIRENGLAILWEKSFRTLLKMLLTEEYEDVIVGRSTGKAPQITMPQNYWDPTCPQYAAFEALLRNCNEDAVAKNFDLVAPIFYRHLSAPTSSNECTTSNAHVVNVSAKLSFMALLQSVISKTNFAKDQLRPFTSNLIENVIAPNLVWQVGSPASALRKVSIASLFTLLRGSGGVTKHLNVSCVSKLFPLVKTNLNDDDASIRHLVCLCLTILLEESSLLLCGKQSEENILDRLYPDLVKALDDSNENVRCAACEAILVFLKKTPISYFSNHVGSTASSVIMYIVKHVMVHMDDPTNRQLQLKCLDVLTAALDIDLAVVIECTKEAPHSRESSTFYEELSRRASEKQSSSL